MVEHFQRFLARLACLTKDEQSLQITKKPKIYCFLRIRSPVTVLTSTTYLPIRSHAIHGTHGAILEL